MTVKPPATPPWKKTVVPEPGQYAWLGEEKLRPVGALGAVVSSSTVWLLTLLMLPTLSSAIHLTVVVPRVVMLKLALLPAISVPLVTVSLPLIVGSEPSVV